VVSTELPILTNSEQIVADGRLPNGTISYMPAMFGLLLAGEVLRDNIQLHIKGL
jgi:tRNA A37 threonylcarbamoyladenosine dehydratase